LSTPIPIELTVETIKQTIGSILIKIIDKYLPKRAIQEENILTKDEQETLDKTKEILKTITSGTNYISDVLDNKQAVVRGCMDKDALNYNPLAVESDGSCVYPAPKTVVLTPTPPPKVVKILPAPVKVEPIPEPPIAEIDVPVTPPPAIIGGGYSGGSTGNNLYNERDYNSGVVNRNGREQAIR
jgi:hypothetical protein